MAKNGGVATSPRPTSSGRSYTSSGTVRPSPWRWPLPGKRRAEQTAEILADYLMPAKGATVRRGFGPDDDVRPLAGSLTVTKTG